MTKMKTESLIDRAKKQIIKGFFYWIWRYISIFIASVFVVLLIAFSIAIPLFIIFGSNHLFSAILGGSMGCLTVLTIHNIPRYQVCWLSIKLNYLRWKALSKTLDPVFCTDIIVQGYINTQLKDLMEDFRK